MDVLAKQVRRARRRLILERFLGRLAWCWFATLLIALAAIAARKIWALGVDGPTWSLAWLGGSLAAGLLAALAWTVCRRQTALDAALEIDHRFGLKERVSSSLSLSPAELETEAGQALVNDASNRIDQVDIADAFAVRLKRRSLLPLIPAVAVAVLLTLIGDPASEQTVAAKTTANKEQVKKPVQALEKKLEQRSRDALKQGHEEAADIFKKIEQGTKELVDKTDLDQKKALVKLNDLSKDIEKRREKLVADDKLKQQFSQLKDLQKGPAEKVADALKKGDFKDAIKELDKLKQQLAKDELSKSEKEQLGKQLEQMHKMLDKLAQAHEQAKKDLQKQIEQARKAGQTEQAQKLQQQLDKLTQESPKAERMADMCKQLSKAAQGLKKGDSKQAQQAMDQLAQELSKLQDAADEMAMLDDALEELTDAKSSMACKNCDGEGCAMCRGQGNMRNQKAGKGLGKGRGAGDRPEKDGKTGFYDSSVKQNVRQGAAVVTGQVDGQNRKGDVEEEIKTAFETAKREAADPLTDQHLPRDRREHSKEYFNAVREGQK